MSLNATIERKVLEGKALKNASLDQRVEFVIQLLDFVKSLNDLHTKQQVMDTLLGYRNPIVDESAISHAKLAVKELVEFRKSEEDRKKKIAEEQQKKAANPKPHTNEDVKEIVIDLQLDRLPSKEWHKERALLKQIDHPFDDIVAKLKENLLTDDQKHKGIDIFIMNLSYLNDELNGSVKFEHDRHGFA